MPFLFFRAIWRLRADPYFRSLAGLTAFAIATGTGVYTFVEGLRVIDAFYLSVVTLCTVGYGDYTPHTDAGKLFTAFYVLVGVGIVLSFVTRVATQTIEDRAGDRAVQHDRLAARRDRKRAA